jgi:hypothetical protein
MGDLGADPNPPTNLAIMHTPVAPICESVYKRPPLCTRRQCLFPRPASMALIGLLPAEDAGALLKTFRQHGRPESTLYQNDKGRPQPYPLVVDQINCSPRVREVSPTSVSTG